MRGTALLRAMRAACELTPAWHHLSCAQPALQQSGWDARASGPVMVLGVAKAHTYKIRANGHHTPSSGCSTPNASGRGPSWTRSHFHYILWKAHVFWWNSNSNFDKNKKQTKIFLYDRDLILQISTAIKIVFYFSYFVLDLSAFQL